MTLVSRCGFHVQQPWFSEHSIRIPFPVSGVLPRILISLTHHPPYLEGVCPDLYLSDEIALDRHFVQQLCQLRVGTYSGGINHFCNPRIPPNPDALIK